MHLSALRRDRSNCSSDTDVSLDAGSGERTADRAVLFPSAVLLSSVPGARILQQPHESKQFIPSGIRDGAILEAVGLPKDYVIAIPRHLDRQGSLSGGPAEHIDDVRAVPVDDHCGALML